MQKNELADRLQKKGIPNITIYKAAILEALDQGYKLTDVHQLLVEDYKLQLTYEGLRHNVNKWRNHKPRKTLKETFEKTTQQKKTPKYSNRSQGSEKKKGSVFANWTGENLSHKELYGVDD